MAAPDFFVAVNRGRPFLLTQPRKIFLVREATNQDVAGNRLPRRELRRPFVCQRHDIFLRAEFLTYFRQFDTPLLPVVVIAPVPSAMPFDDRTALRSSYHRVHLHVGLRLSLKMTANAREIYCGKLFSRFDLTSNWEGPILG